MYRAKTRTKPSPLSRAPHASPHYALGQQVQALGPSLASCLLPSKASLHSLLEASVMLAP